MIEVSLPLRTVSALNAREHWRKRAARVKKERETTGWMLTGQRVPELPVVVTMTRVGPTNGLDDDNLVSSCKGIRDAIAKWLGVDDRTKLVTWKCEQRRCAQGWAVHVQIAAAPVLEEEGAF